MVLSKHGGARLREGSGHWRGASSEMDEKRKRSFTLIPVSASVPINPAFLASARFLGSLTRVRAIVPSLAGTNSRSSPRSTRRRARHHSFRASKQHSSSPRIISL